MIEDEQSQLRIPGEPFNFEAIEAARKSAKSWSSYLFNRRVAMYNIINNIFMHYDIINKVYKFVSIY